MATTGAASTPDEPAREGKKTAQPAKTTSRAGRDLRAAIAVGAGIGGVLIVTLVFAPRFWVAIVAIAIPVATHEVVRRLREAGYVIPLIPLLIGGQATVWLTWPFHAAGALAGFGGTVVVCNVWRLFMQDNSKRPEPFAGSPSANYLRDASATVFLAAWVPLFASFGAMLVYPKDGAGRVFCLMVTVVASDVGGYAVGVLFGKHPMVPAISPKKSWEGFAGSLVFGITAAILTATFLARKPLWIGAVLGVILVLTCTLGDLVESQIKRDLGIKDMGRLLPGHGGLMDRLDGVLPSAVAAWTVLTLVP
ncbi:MULTISPECIES: phosphatidate cytidylyltransferase [unclassified Mycobacterium]|uniref:phosphatidate cytidylyltransferase n=1 Tax=unclassified Mycobacterium TaxID=2642494 RepID=UPI0007FF1CF7|nr:MULTISPECIES: phosphatidate cytidylyltransferase [unclassified Mycobacterium]OBG49315.1 phosphatidate cytidylyltransferase [Mycobacterium sp. E735]OBG64208.1 phosphatidate cytidylyltransferase [Mycobacterium sp. E188]OBG73045.1 phosphatidate cytidylyltransferase [Mycobacterium sp. E3298]OBG81507.1 phosphatidate cytidylyltransferase [Mycobacterium sp. E3305]OBH25565.1 phosphatidate cytidylyltransferase [Mycobacterium sp. E1715]